MSARTDRLPVSGRFPTKSLLALATLSGVALAFLALVRRAAGRPAGEIAAAGLLLAAAIHASFALTAFLNVGLVRYAMAMWPLQVALLLFCGAGLIGIAGRLAQSRTQ
jgi:hypothetical protein